MPRYDDPEFTLKREVVLPAPAAGNAAVSKFALFAAAKVLQAQAVVKGVGTSASSGAYVQVLQNGTTTLGTLLTGSSTAGSLITATLTGNLAAGDQISLVHGTDATASVYGVTLQYQEAVV
jgi:hypothetical protein